MGRLKIKNKKYYLAIIFAVVLILLPTHQASASCGIIFGTISDCVLEASSYLVFLMFTVIGKIIAFLATTLQIVINIPVYPSEGLEVVDKSWEIMRNFANMFFIVALIIMAFATIFDVFPGAAKYNARALFGKFLFTALLINFSLVLGVMVIQGTQVLSNTFLTSIGDMSSRLGQGMDGSNLFPKASATTASEAIEKGLFGALISLIFVDVLLITFLFSILTALTFAFIRIPILWALLVVSPIAWILNVFPAGQGIFKKWWSTFIGWNMFLPIFLFFLYFGLYFLQSQAAIMNSIANQTRNQSLGEGVPFTIQQIFFYVLTTIFLIGGTIVAMKASMFSGTGVVGIAKWSRGVAARRLGLTAAGGAAQQLKGQIAQEGLPGRFGLLYGGQAGLERQTSGWAERFGVRGAADKQLAKDIAFNKEKFKNITDPNELKTKMNSGSNQEQLAIREIMKDRGLLDNAELEKTYRLYGGNETLAGKQFSRNINYDKLSSTERGNWYRQTTDVETKQKIAGVMADRGEFDTVADIQNALTLYSLPGDKAAFLKKAGRRITDNNTLRPLIATGSDQEKLAVREILAERGALNGAELFDTYSMYRAGSKEAIDFGAKVDFGNLSRGDRQTWYSNAPDVEVKRKVAEIMIEKGDLGMLTLPGLTDPTQPELTTVAGAPGTPGALFANDADRIKFLEKGEKKNFMATIKAKAVLGIVRDATGIPLTTPDAVLQNRVKIMKAGDLAEIGYDGGWADPDFINAVQTKINTLQASQVPVPSRPADPALPVGPTNPLIPGKIGGGEKFKTDLQNSATDSRSLRKISTLTIP